MGGAAPRILRRVGFLKALWVPHWLGVWQRVAPPNLRALGALLNPHSQCHSLSVLSKLGGGGGAVLRALSLGAPCGQALLCLHRKKLWTHVCGSPVERATQVSAPNCEFWHEPHPYSFPEPRRPPAGSVLGYLSRLPGSPAWSSRQGR